MRKYQTLTIPESKREQQTHLVCDMCGYEVKEYGDDWSGYGYDVREIEIRHKDGCHFPEGGYGTEINFDVCPTCWTDNVLPWLLDNCKTNKPEYKKYDY